MKGCARRLVLVVAAIVVVLVIAAVLAPFLIDADRFRPVVEARLGGLIGRPVALGHLSLSLWTGPVLTADAIVVKAPPSAPPGTAPELQAQRAVIRPRLRPFLHGEVDLRSVKLRGARVVQGDRLLLHDADIEGTVRYAGGRTETQGRLDGVVSAIPGAPLTHALWAGALEGDRITIDRLTADSTSGQLGVTGEIVGLHAEAPRARVKGTARIREMDLAGEISVALLADHNEIGFDLASPRIDVDRLAAAAAWAAGGGGTPGAGTSGSRWARTMGKGTLRAKQARFSGLDLTNLTTRVTLSGGAVRLDDTGFGLYGGRHDGSLTLEILKQGVPFSVRSRIEGVDVDALLRAWVPASAGTLRGSAAMSLDLAGIATAPAITPTLGGTAHVEVRDGMLASVGLLRQVAVLLEAAGGRGIGQETTPFRSFTATFAIQGGVGRTGDLKVHADDLDLEGSGIVDLRGPVDLTCTALFSPDVSASMVQKTPKLRSRLDPTGRLTVPLLIQGTMHEPAVRIDLRRMVESTLKERFGNQLKDKVKQKESDILKRLLGGH